MEFVGLVPAAGRAERLGRLPCSKELYPLGYGKIDGQYGSCQVVCHHLLQAFQISGISNVFIVIREGKWDIPTFLGDGSKLGLNLAYLMMRLPYGVPFTIDQAYPFLRNKGVAFGFPDIHFKSKNVFSKLIDRLFEVKADVVLGLFMTPQPDNVDMVEVESSDGRILALHTKPENSPLLYTWAVAVWTPRFTHYMRTFLKEMLERDEMMSGRDEIIMGDVMRGAVKAELRVNSVCFPDEWCVDLGTPSNLMDSLSGKLDP